MLPHRLRDPQLLRGRLPRRRGSVSRLEAATFYQSQEDAILALNAAYTPLQYQGGFRRFPYLLDYMSGDLDITSGGRQLTDYPGFNFNAASPNLIPATWNAMFVGISRANVVL